MIGLLERSSGGESAVQQIVLEVLQMMKPHGLIRAIAALAARSITKFR